MQQGKNWTKARRKKIYNLLLRAYFVMESLRDAGADDDSDECQWYDEFRKLAIEMDWIKEG